MGFRNLLLFNQSLLHIQSSRLLVYPDSLCARQMKAKYYPHGLLRDTVVARYPVWPRITQAWSHSEGL